MGQGRREIFERLEALERMVRSGHEGRGSGEHGRRGGCDHHHHHDHEHDCGEGQFQEKRIIDTIVRLVTEQVSRVVEDQQAKSKGSDDGGGEKRFIDLIVSLVSEHVQEIVATELDRRLGRPGLGRAGEGSPEPEKP